MKRRGRPELKEDELRKPRSFKANEAEWEQVKTKAKEAGVSASEYIRAKALGICEDP